MLPVVMHKFCIKYKPATSIVQNLTIFLILTWKQSSGSLLEIWQWRSKLKRKQKFCLNITEKSEILTQRWVRRVLQNLYRNALTFSDTSKFHGVRKCCS